MLKEVTKNLQATSPTYTRSPLRESMQTGLTVTKGAGSDNPFSMATALATSNPPSVGLSEGGHSGVMNGELSLVEKNTPIKLTIKRKAIPSDSTSSSPVHEDCAKSDQGNNVPIIGHPDPSTHRHTVVNGKVLPSSSSSSSLSHSAHGEQSRTTSKRTSSGPSATKRPKSASKRDRSSSGKSTILPMSSSSGLVNGRPNSAERSHDPYQFSVKKEEETVLPPKKLRLDSSLNRLPERSESFKDQGTNTRSQGTSIEHDLLGPCEPGTQINLGGYVCLETLTGTLMVSVRWRNRTYLGTLIDTTSHGFSPPVPPSYVYHSNRYTSAVEPGANSSSSNGNGRNQRGRGKRRCGFAPATGARHSRKGRRNARGSPVTGSSSVAAASLSINPGDDSNEESQSRGESPASENPLDDGEPSFKCPQPGCHKRFKDGTAGKLHMDECHAKKIPDLPSDSESREKRPKTTKAAGKSKKHASNSSAARVSNSQVPAVKSEPVASGTGAEMRTVKATETVTIKSESNASNIPPSFFKTPINNGLTSPPLLPYSPTSPAPHLPASPANGLKHPGGSGNSCSPETLTLPLNASSHQMKLSPSTTQQQIPPTQQQQQQPPPQQQQQQQQQQQHELPVRIPTSNMLMRVGVTSTAGGTSISSSTISSVNSSVSAPRTVTATTVKTIPVMKPSTVASSSSLSSTSASGGKKVNSKDSKNSGNGKSGNARSHVSGTVSASTVTVPSVSSPLSSSSQTPGTCSSTLKPIQPKPLVPHIPSPTGNNGCKNSTPSNSSVINDSSAKRPSNANPSRKRKKSSGTGSESGKRQSLSSSSSGSGARTSQGKPVAGGKRSSGNSGSVCSEGTNPGQGDRASPAYSDISDDNESPIPILEKEGDVKLISDTTSGCDEVGKASEQAGHYNTPPSLVPYAVPFAEQVPGSANNAARTPNASGGAPRPTNLAKKASSPIEALPAGASAPPLGKASTPVIPGTAPLALSANQAMKKTEPGRKPDFGGEGLPSVGASVASVESLIGNDAPEKPESSKLPSRDPSHSGEEHVRVKKGNEPPNLTKISTPTPLTTLTLPSTASSVTTPTSSLPSTSLSSQGTVAKPTPVNPLSPSRSSDLPTSTPAVVTPGALVGGSRASELYSNRPDHLPTPPSFHPASAGGPFGPGAQFAAHLSSPGTLGPQGPFNQYTEMMRFVHTGGPHPPGPFGGYSYPAEPFFASPPVSSAPQPHKIHELVEKGVAATSTPSSTSNVPGIPSLCNTTSTTTACSVANKPPVCVESAIPMDLQTAKSYADMAVAMRHHASILPNHSGLPQGPTHAGMVPHFPYSSAIPPAHMAAPPFAAMQQHSLPPGHPPTPGPDPFFPPSTILNHHLYK